MRNISNFHFFLEFCKFSSFPTMSLHSLYLKNKHKNKKCHLKFKFFVLGTSNKYIIKWLLENKKFQKHNHKKVILRQLKKFEYREFHDRDKLWLFCKSKKYTIT